MPPEYDDGYPDKQAFEAAGADRPEDMEDPMDRWEDAVKHFSLDPAYNYSQREKLAYIRAYDTSAPRPYTIDEWGRILDNMQNFGGHFAQYIGKAMQHADSSNKRRIERAFPDLLERYGSTDWDVHNR